MFFALMTMAISRPRLFALENKKKKITGRPSMRTDTKVIVLQPWDNVRSDVHKHFKQFSIDVFCTPDPKKAINAVPKKGKCIIVSEYYFPHDYNAQFIASQVKERNAKAKMCVVSGENILDDPSTNLFDGIKKAENREDCTAKVIQTIERRLRSTKKEIELDFTS